MVGSCTNGSWHDMSSVVGVVRDKQVHPSISFVVFPGSHRILETMAREGLLADLLATGATVSEPTCGSCAGIGHVPMFDDPALVVRTILEFTDRVDHPAADRPAARTEETA